MKRAILLLTLVGAMLLACTGVVLAQQNGPDRTASDNGQQRAENVRPDHYVVVLKDNVANPGEVARQHARDHGARPSHVYEHALKGYAAYIPASRLDKVKNDGRVQFVEQDRELYAVGQTLPTGVDRIEGDASSTLAGNGSGSTNKAVAVIDTGIDTSRSNELKVVGGKNCTWYGGGYNDANGHGSHVAGTASAGDNADGPVGVALGAPLYSVRVLGPNGSGYLSWINCGIDWVAANAKNSDGTQKIPVANMSLGGGGSDDNNCGNSNNDSMHKAICKAVNTKGVTFVVAAGNSNKDLKDFTPAAYNEVLTVTAAADFNGQPGGGAAATCRSDVDETAADFSNWTTVGSTDEGHTVAAPGVCIYSTWKSGGYNTISGTSMASPHVAGLAALCLRDGGPCAGMTPSQVIAKLRNDASLRPASYGFTDDPNSPNGSRYYGYLSYAGGY